MKKTEPTRITNTKYPNVQQAGPMHGRRGRSSSGRAAERSTCAGAIQSPMTTAVMA